MKIEDVRKLLDIVSPAPWSRTHIYAGEEVIYSRQTTEHIPLVATAVTKADAAFIVLARDLLLKLIKVAEAAKAFDDYYLAENFVGHAITAAFEPVADALAALESD